ncbi:F-box only protein 8-like [Rutidosis leptorrhynchoides]|uniref:F-box only protein 8-like n=1 Tax=Rutidosis leptorrhynchoides TaxID=125765 RepID=UPI003A99548F
MAYYIPLVLQIKILCYLPVESLIRFRSVSKEWKSLIDGPDFNSDYIVRQAQRKRLLLWCEYKNNDWIVVDDDDSFPQHKMNLSHPRFFNRLLNTDRIEFVDTTQIEFVGSSYGLLCFAGRYLSEDYFNRYVIWNPLIRKSVAIDAPYYEDVFVGFGVCPNTLDPKIVRINIIHVSRDDVVSYKDIDRVWRVEVFTLSGGVWRSPLTKLPRKWLKIDLYFEGIGYKTPAVMNGFICCSKGYVYDVWSMDNVSKFFAKLYSVTLPNMYRHVLGFRDNEQLIIVKSNDEREPEFVAYEPNLKHFNDLGSYVSCSSFTSYTESLLLLNQSGTLNDDDDDDEGDEHTTRFLDHES